MIRLTFLLRRRPGMSLQEFQSYWLETHGPLVAGEARHLKMLRYVQVHTLDEPVNQGPWGMRGQMEPPYDGVAEAWWESRGDLVAAVESAEGQAAGAKLVEDERRFIDLANSPLWLNYEYPQVNPAPEDIVAGPRSSIVKLYFPLRHLPGQSLDEAQLYWRTQHGPLIRSQASAMRALRYIQVHRFEDEIEAGLRAARGTAVEPYTGHAELWFDRNETGSPSPERREAAKRAEEDERKFIDFGRSTMWFAKEHVFVDRR
ncbi:MAG TPA: EthD domain-containing protein [Tepidiformaceae bacterium]